MTPTALERQTEDDGVVQVHELVHGGRVRRYFLEAPIAPRAELPALVIELHGRGIDPVWFDGWTGLSGYGRDAGFITAMPAAVDERWNDGRVEAPRWTSIDDVGFITRVVEDVASKTPIDRSRIYVVGMSNGATMAGRVALEAPPLAAAIAQVAGTAEAGVLAANQSPAARTVDPLPLLHIHGTADRIAPYAGGRARGLGRVLTLMGRATARPAVGVDEWAERWVRRNGADPTPAVERLGDDTTVRRWRGASPASDVVFYRVEGGGHAWPSARGYTPFILGRCSRTFDATALIWEFLREHRRVEA